MTDYRPPITVYRITLTQPAPRPILAAMHIDILTLFPEMFPGYLNESILKRAQAAGLLQINLHNLREYATGKHRITDEPPYGGGGGMVLKPEPIFTAVESLISNFQSPNLPIILLTPQGRPFTQTVAQELAAHPRLLLLCGRYEGVDERVQQHLVTDEISIGDFVLTGGELAAMVLVDAVAGYCPACWAQKMPQKMTATLPVCWKAPTTPAPKHSATGRCQRCCALAMPPTLPAGDGSKRCAAPGSAAQTCCSLPPSARKIAGFWAN